MEQNRVCVIKSGKYNYPKADERFRPSVCYAEYLYKQDIAQEENHVYQMVRDGLQMCGLDTVHYGTADWNPLGEFIKPGERVLIKPNLVLHENLGGYGEDCLYTHPSVTAAVIDYVIIALKGKGKIVIGDAPLQECVFDVLLNTSGYRKLVEYYVAKGIDIKIVDFRNTKTYIQDGIHYHQTEEQTDHGTIVQMNEISLFSEKTKKELRKLRITNYDPRILQQHHNSKKHEYNISNEVLLADVIINMPKPKTHRKAGITGALKNLVGINANKEYLPHHTLGSSKEGGDAYQNSNFLLKVANYLLDWSNIYNNKGKFETAKKYVDAYKRVYQKGNRISHEKYWEGSWYGNNTIWRTIVDLNRIMLYADKFGIMTDKVQRKSFIIGDMVISGEKEGPLEPSPKEAGVLIFGMNPVCVDKVIASLMGFDYSDIPSIGNREIYKGRCAFTEYRHVDIVSNEKMWDQKELESIKQKASLKFEPTMGWEDKLGSPKKQIMCEKIKNKGCRVAVFGAGKKGIAIADYLQQRGVKVEIFCDNDISKQGKVVWKNIQCIAPEKLDSSYLCIITTPERYNDVVIEQLKQIGIAEYCLI